MKALFYTAVVAFTMENILASAQQYTVHACKSHQVQLNCRNGLIEVLDVVLADSRCSRSSCCPRSGDCRGSPSQGYRDEVLILCNDRQSCSPRVEIRNIGCGLIGPSNDYVNITYRCKAIETSNLPSTSSTTQLPSTSSTTQLPSSSSTTQLPSTSSTTQLPSFPIHSSVSLWGHFSFTTTWESPTPSTSTQISSTPSHDSKTTKHHLKPEKTTPDSKPEESAFEAQSKQGNDSGYQDRITLLLSIGVIVGGVVITAIVISVAVVLVSKKRRTVKPDESYDMPNYPCNANTDDENVRNSNFYDFIPDTGICHSSQSARVETKEKENDYLTPVIEREEAPYMWIP